MKKYVILLTLLLLSACSVEKKIEYFEDKDSFERVVVSTTNDSALLNVFQRADFTYPQIVIPIEAIAVDSYKDLEKNDSIIVYYDGVVMESDLAQVKEVYAIKLKGKPITSSKTVNTEMGIDVILISEPHNPNEIMYKLINTSDNTYTIDDTYYIEIEGEKDWIELPTLTDYNDSKVAYTLYPNTTENSKPYDLETRVGALNYGNYRFINPLQIKMEMYSILALNLKFNHSKRM